MFKRRQRLRWPGPSPLDRILDWRERLLFHWHLWDRSEVGFLAAFPVPFVVLALLLHSANEDRSRIEAERRVRAEQIAAERHREEEIRCLAENIYHEARGEPLAGRFAVAEVTLNRVASPLFPSTVCEVVHEQRWDAIRKRYVAAFSWTELDAPETPSGEAWEQALATAEAAYDERAAPRVAGALFYHATSVHPSWARTKKRVAKIGRHVFYR